MLSIIENGVKFDDLAVIDKTLDFDLFEELLANFFLFDLGLFDDFDWKDHSCFLMPELNKRYFAILTLPNLPFPKSFPNSKSVIFSCFKFLYEAKVEIVYFKSPFSKYYFLFVFPKLSFSFFFPNWKC